MIIIITATHRIKALKYLEAISRMPKQLVSDEESSKIARYPDRYWPMTAVAFLTS